MMRVLDYNKHLQDFRKAWLNGVEQNRIALIAMNDMIRALHIDHPDWSMNKIALKIANENRDLPGFSSRNVIRQLDSENEELIHKKGLTSVKQNNYNNDSEPDLSNYPASWSGNEETEESETDRQIEAANDIETFNFEDVSINEVEELIISNCKGHKTLKNLSFTIDKNVI